MNSPSTNKPETVECLLDFGPQPICSHFSATLAGNQEQYPLSLSIKQESGLIFLTDPFPVESLVPRFDWIKYNEPESHLDRMVDSVLGLPGVTAASRICGLSYKDDSTLARLERRGLTNIRRLEPAEDLSIHNPSGNIESIQHALTRAKTREIALRQGRADVLIARHILEHANNPEEFVAALKELITPDGVLIIEIPDCQKSLEILDYTMAWEEHTLYFTEPTFKSFASAAGLTPTTVERYPYPFEDSLVGYFRPTTTRSAVFSVDISAEIARAKQYACAFPDVVANTRAFFAQHASKKIVIFGAGHLACSFINLFQVRDFIEYAIDDNPHKQGYYLPGSMLPIRSSVALQEQDVDICLMGINPLAEPAVIQKLSPLVSTIFSLFPGSPYRLPLQHP